MSRLHKTRALLKTLLEKERIAQQGRPITDMDQREVARELDRVEFKLRIARALYWLCVGILTGAAIVHLTQ
jgi:hypothetical protein